jgi:hypothetical protein
MCDGNFSYHLAVLPFLLGEAITAPALPEGAFGLQFCKL